MNNYYILGFSVAIILLVLILLTTGEFKDISKEATSIVKDHHHIPSQEGPSRGGNMMYEINNLGVPGWKWGRCCSS